MSNKNLHKLLEIRDSRHESIFDIVGRMEVTLDYLQENKRFKNLAPFLWIYYLITKTVAERSVTNKAYFRNPEALEKLDIRFASMYFDPLLAFLETGTMRKPWQTYFQYCSKPGGTPFVHMLLGINSHINGDLLAAVSSTGYTERHDFQKINSILDEEIPSMLKFLVLKNHDIYAFGGLMFKQFVEEEFKETVVNWRNMVWKNSLSTKSALMRSKSFRQTEEIAGNIIKIFDDASHFTHIPHLVSKLNGLSINLSK